MILVQKQTHKPIEQNRELRNKATVNKRSWDKWLAICRRLKLDPYFSPHTKINSRLIKDLNVNHQALKILEENLINALPDIGLGKEFLALLPKAVGTKTKLTSGT